MEQLTSLPSLGDPGNMEPWALPAWQSWTPGRGGDAGGASPSMAGTPTDLRVGELRPEESSEPEGARSLGPVGGMEPGGTGTGLPSPARGALSSGPGCQRLEDPEAEAFSKVRELRSAGVCETGALTLPAGLGMVRDFTAPCLLRAYFCLGVHLSDRLSSLLWAEISVVPFFTICLSF